MATNSIIPKKKNPHSMAINEPEQMISSPYAKNPIVGSLIYGTNKTVQAPKAKTAQQRYDDKVQSFADNPIDRTLGWRSANAIRGQRTAQLHDMAMMAGQDSRAQTGQGTQNVQRYGIDSRAQTGRDRTVLDKMKLTQNQNQFNQGQQMKSAAMGQDENQFNQRLQQTLQQQQIAQARQNTSDAYRQENLRINQQRLEGTQQQQENKNIAARQKQINEGYDPYNNTDFDNDDAAAQAKAYWAQTGELAPLESNAWWGDGEMVMSEGQPQAQQQQQQQQQRTVTRRGKDGGGRNVVEYSDGSIEFE